MRSWMILAMCCVSFAASVSRAESQEVASAVEVLGRYQLVDAEAAARTIHDAIEHAVDGMDFISQPLATGRLRDTSPVRRWIEVARDGERVRLTLDGGTSLVTSPGVRTRLRVDADGDADVEQRFEGAELVQIVSREQGTRRLRLAPTPRGLRAYFRIESERLPRAVDYMLEYTRVGTGVAP